MPLAEGEVPAVPPQRKAPGTFSFLSTPKGDTVEITLTCASGKSSSRDLHEAAITGGTPGGTLWLFGNFEKLPSITLPSETDF